jgi:hypothetical protein
MLAIEYRRILRQNFSFQSVLDCWLADVSLGKAGLNILSGDWRSEQKTLVLSTYRQLNRRMIECDK